MTDDIVDRLLQATARVMEHARPPLVVEVDVEEHVRHGIVNARRTAAAVLIVQDGGASLEVFVIDRSRREFLAALETGHIDAARRRDRVTVRFLHNGSMWLPVPSRWYDGEARMVTRDECLLLVTALDHLERHFASATRGAR